MKEMDKFQERKKRSKDVLEEDDDLLISIDKLVEEVELSLNRRPSSSDSEDGGWETIWEALNEQIELETEVKFVAEGYERVQQDILDCRNDMEKLLQEIKEAKQQSDDQWDAEDTKGDEGSTSYLQKVQNPDQNTSKHKELRESFRCKQPFAAEPHVETNESKLLTEEKLPTFHPEEHSKLLRWLEAELQQEKKVVQEELEKVKVSCADEIQKYKVQLQNVHQQLLSLQQVHQKDLQKVLKEQSELSKQEVKKAKAAYETELQTCKDELEDCKLQNEILQRNLRKAQESSGKEQPSVQELQACQKDLSTFKKQMDSFHRNPRGSLQSSESSLFMTGLGSVGMLSNKGLSQSFKNTEKKVRNKVLSLQSELEKSRNETQKEKKECERLQREKESIQMSYKTQQNELSYTKRHFDSMHAQLEDYKKRMESKTEEVDHLKKDLKKVKKSCKKKHEKKTKSKTADAEDRIQTNPSQSEEEEEKKKKKKKRRLKEEGNTWVEPPTEKTTPKKQHNQKCSAEGEGKASHHAETSPESQKSSRSPHKFTFTKVCDFLGLRKPKK